MPRQLSKDERHELRSLISAEAHRRINAIAIDNPEYEEEVETYARKRAVGILGIEKQLVEIDKLNARRQAIDGEQEALRREDEELEARVDKLEREIRLDMPKKKVPSYAREACGVPRTVCEAINNVMEVTRIEAIKKNPVAKKIEDVRELERKKLTKLAACVTLLDVQDSKVLIWD